MVLEGATINVTDLPTLELLSRKPAEEASGPSHLWNLASYAYPLIVRLHVTLRLPLAVYEALASVQDDQPGYAAQYAGADAKAVACATWARAWAAVGQLPHLRNLHVWLDHDGSSSWSHVRERQAVGKSLMDVLATHLQDRSRVENPPPGGGGSLQSPQTASGPGETGNPLCAREPAAAIFHRAALSYELLC
ncbi:hypothetical protein PG997_015092 [Apiospora hydei]|uniref:Uncharacterized protein n=1 Tax=Apiospora hydei TaxID=1337664 RepID=A0ABR1UVS1_9PEZI